MRRLTAVLTLAALVVLPACSSSGKKAAKSSAASSSPSSVAVTASDLATKLQHGVSGIQTAQVSLNATILGQQIDGAGPAKFAGGSLSAVDIKGSIPGLGNLRLLVVDGKVYAHLPTALNKSGKPWVLVTPESTNTTVAQLGSVLSQIEAAASLDSLAILVRASSTLTSKGTETIDGAPATHYSMLIDASKLPASFPGKADLAKPKLHDKPTELWVDAKGRPVKASRPLLVSGSEVDVTIGLGEFNSPVTITPPAASDVATD